MSLRSRCVEVRLCSPSVSSPSITVEMAPSWRRGVRGAIYDALFSGYRGYWLIRLAFAILLEETARASLGRLFHASTDLGAVGIASIIVVLSATWFSYPVLRGRADVGSVLTILDEGLIVEAKHFSLSAAWGAVRAVRRTPWDLVFVLDGTCVSVPVAGMTPGTVDSACERFRRAHESPRETGRNHPMPYRTAEARPASPEDEEATPEEWRAPSHYRFSVLAFPTRAQNVLATISLRRSAFKWPGVMLAMAGLFMFIATAPVDDNTLRAPLMLVAAFITAFAVGLLALDFSPALLALRDRFVRERSAGVLYAVGPSGLYMRTQSLERRELWDGVSALRVSRKRLSLRSGSGIHVIPLRPSEQENERKNFVKMIASEVAARLPPAS